MEYKDWKLLISGTDVRGVATEGVVGESVTLTEEKVRSLAYAFVFWLSQKVADSRDLVISIGRDTRISGERFAQIVRDAFLECGCNVYECGITTTPSMYLCVGQEGCDGAVMITASHMPYNRNGFKFFTRSGALDAPDIEELIFLASQGKKLLSSTPGKALPLDIMSIYAQQLICFAQKKTGKEKPFTGLKILVDAGNGAGGYYVHNVLKPLGADTTGSQFLEPDGRFPNHVPNPEDEAAMRSVSDAVLKWHADLGVCLDTDVDRAGIVDSVGVEINRNKLIALVSAVLLREQQGITIVTDSVTSNGLTQFIQAHGGKHHRFMRGYKKVINEALRLNAQGIDCPLAMETSGHAALRENAFIDDGSYIVTRLLIEMSRLREQGQSLDALISDLKEPIEIDEIRIKITEEDFKAYGRQIIQDLNTYAPTVSGWQIAPENYEGVKIFCTDVKEDGWFLLRLSVHDPVLAINLESDISGGVRHIRERLCDFLRPYDGLDNLL